jgi:hypothetical protein
VQVHIFVSQKVPDDTSVSLANSPPAFPYIADIMGGSTSVIIIPTHAPRIIAVAYPAALALVSAPATWPAAYTSPAAITSSMQIMGISSINCPQRHPIPHFMDCAAGMVNWENTTEVNPSANTAKTSILRNAGKSILSPARNRKIKVKKISSCLRSS